MPKGGVREEILGDEAGHSNISPQWEMTWSATLNEILQNCAWLFPELFRERHARSVVLLTWQICTNSFIHAIMMTYTRAL